MNVIVKFGEKAVTYGFVNLSNNQTGLGAGQLLDQNGVAQLKKVPVGDYVITVTLPPPETAVANHVVKETSELPQKYRSETTSTLRATVQKGTSEITVNLKD